MRGLAVTSGKRFPGLPVLPSLQGDGAGHGDGRLFCHGGAGGHVGGDGGAAQPRDQAFLKGPEIQDRLLALGLATEGGGTPESARADHPAGAGAVARAREGVGVDPQ